MTETVIKTPRLVLRSWRDSDLAPFAALNADPRVMAPLMGAISRARSDALARSIRDHEAEHGYTLWAVEVPDEAPFVGFVGLRWFTVDVPCAPAVEIGWRLARDHWGKGYATEAARAAMAAAFTRFGLDHLISITAHINARSITVMQKLGMSRDPGEDFDHPLVPADDPLHRHLVMRRTREDWARNHHKA